MKPDRRELFEKLCLELYGPDGMRKVEGVIAGRMERFGWSMLIEDFEIDVETCRVHVHASAINHTGLCTMQTKWLLGRR